MSTFEMPRQHILIGLALSHNPRPVRFTVRDDDPRLVGVQVQGGQVVILPIAELYRVVAVLMSDCMSTVPPHEVQL